MTTRGRRALVAAAVSTVLLSSCSGHDDKSSAKPTPTTLTAVTQIPGIVMIDKDDPWPTYATARITELEAGVGGTTININYEAGPDLCSALAGYAVQRTAKFAVVTVVLGRKATCTGKGTVHTTVLPLTAPLGKAEPTVSDYSKTSIAIK